MPAPSDRNARIALAKGWTVKSNPALDLRGQPIIWKGMPAYKHAWYTPGGKYHGDTSPDYVGTLEGVAGMMRELQARRRPMSQWAWYWNDRKQRFEMRYAAWRRSLFRRQVLAVFHSPSDRPGDCVGDAYLAMKEGADASTE